jgi:hypothetical protein
MSDSIRIQPIRPVEPIVPGLTSTISGNAVYPSMTARTRVRTGADAIAAVIAGRLLYTAKQFRTGLFLKYLLRGLGVLCQDKIVGALRRFKRTVTRIPQRP